MASREIPEINAGSMADIAFLLLIFWLVTTTMDRDIGVRLKLPRELPPCEECPDVRKRNVLEIAVNGNDDLLIEQAPGVLEDVDQWVLDFYTKLDDDNLPERHRVDKTIIQDTLAKLSLELTEAGKITDLVKKVKVEAKFSDIIKEWEKKEAALELIGPFDCIHKRAVIRFESNNGTTFEVYFSVLDRIKSVLQQLRNDLASDKFGMSYDEMYKIKDEDLTVRPKIQAIRTMYPLRLLEPDPRNS
jgi:biopolymer transport protein ExbD